MNDETELFNRVMDAGRRLLSITDPEQVPVRFEAEARELTGTESGAAADRSVALLAEFAATATENARRLRDAEAGRSELARAVRSLEAAHAISLAIGSDLSLEAILELIVGHGSALVDARSVAIMLIDGDELELAAITGPGPGRLGTRIPLAGSNAETALRNQRATRVEQVAPRQSDGDRLNLSVVRTALVVPMFHRGEGIGALIAFDRGDDRTPFTSGDEELMSSFAASAANAVAVARSVKADRLRAAIESAESERQRWAHELHDQTLQSLGVLVNMVAAARRTAAGDSALDDTLALVASGIEGEVNNLRAIIADLRPPLIDDLGLADALEALITQRRAQGLDVSLSVQFEHPDGRRIRLASELEITIYRLVQEALTSMAKPSRTGEILIRLNAPTLTELQLDVVDSGPAPHSAGPAAGFALGLLTERIQLAGGELTFESGSDGTALYLRLPIDPVPASAR